MMTMLSWMMPVKTNTEWQTQALRLLHLAASCLSKSNGALSMLIPFSLFLSWSCFVWHSEILSYVSLLCAFHFFYLPVFWLPMYCMFKECVLIWTAAYARMHLHVKLLLYLYLLPHAFMLICIDLLIYVIFPVKYKLCVRSVWSLHKTALMSQNKRTAFSLSGEAAACNSRKLLSVCVWVFSPCWCNSVRLACALTELTHHLATADTNLTHATPCCHDN